MASNTSIQNKAIKKKASKKVSLNSAGISPGRWFSDHLDSSLDSLSRFVRSPLQSLMTLLVIAVALSLPSMLYLLVKTANTSISEFEQTADISVYFEPGTSEQVSQRVQAAVLSLHAVNAARFLSPDKALEEFQKYSGLGQTLALLNENPLPATLLVTPEIETVNIDHLIKSIEQMDAVDQVQFDYLWLQRLQSLLLIVERVILILAVLLSLGVVLILGNTIRLEIESRRDEVVVIKLVGGTNAFVRRPLLYTGVWFGLLGALSAWFITNIFALLMLKPLQALSELYLSDATLVGLDSMDLLVLLLIGFVLGWLGAWIAAARHLSSIEPK